MTSKNAYSTAEMTDFSGIKTSLLKLHPFSEEQLNQFAGRLNFENLKKKGFLLKPPQTSNCLAFIISGSLRLYTQTTRGELTINFFTENQWVADIDSFLLQQPSKNYIQAFEDAVIASITLRHIHELMDSHPSFRQLNALIAGFTIPAKHLATISTQSPDLRYKELLTRQPDWVNRFPQMQIASYLGMTPATLSRVRARVG